MIPSLVFLKKLGQLIRGEKKEYYSRPKQEDGQKTTVKIDAKAYSQEGKRHLLSLSRVTQELRQEGKASIQQGNVGSLLFTTDNALDT